MLRLAAHTLARSLLHVQNIIAWRQRNAIISIFVRSNARDFFFLVAAQDEQRILSVVFRRDRRRVFIAEVDRITRKNFQMSFDETLRQTIAQCSAAS